VLWLSGGSLSLIGKPDRICLAYNQFIDKEGTATEILTTLKTSTWDNTNQHHQSKTGTATLKKIVLSSDGQSTPPLRLSSMHSTLEVEIEFNSDPNLPCPNIGVVITDYKGSNITSCCNLYDEVHLIRRANGEGHVKIEFPSIPFLRGDFTAHVFLLCEQAIHIYDSAICGDFEVRQEGLEIGIFACQRNWLHL
jgi:lipopolysaccharide transport system ATP-binding protein